MTYDARILIAPCVKTRDVQFVQVDDFDDPDEAEITAEEIHVTVFQGLDADGFGRDVLTCFKLSTTSARELVARLQAAIDRRGTT